ncbi:unnamed protein product [Meloidogyne enterolobii]|uniref:Uncharacterized protein n=1 Tax=Meloidogyne enterolobii TaxID=390850 RepID=A0ACB0ZSR3_MELEN
MLTTFNNSLKEGAGTSKRESVREQPDKQEEEEEEVIALPLWQDSGGQPIKLPMESIPEVEEIEGGSFGLCVFVFDKKLFEKKITEMY